ncbi:MAG: hypothetical protein JNM69_39590 [Archangium sp.]|nr:hypothetical protein [Archangium sp.]
MSRVLSLIVAGLVVACSPTVSPQPVKGRTTVAPNATYFWKVASSTVEWGTCADAADFRANVAPLPFSMNSFLIYKTDAEAKTAIAQSCTSLDPNTCMNSSSNVVFTVAGTELTFPRAETEDVLRVRDPNGVERDSTCKLTQLETWTMRDQGEKFELEVTNALGLKETGTMADECKLIEDNLIARSPNMAGVRGCILTFKLTGDLR